MAETNLSSYQGHSVKLRSYKKQDERVEMKRRGNQAIEKSVVPRNEN